MASGIVEVFVKSGFDVTVIARSDAKCEAVSARVAKSLDRAVSKGRMEQADRDAALGRIQGATDVEALADVDLVVEAVVEDLDVKLDLFQRLDRVCKPGAVLATTTSSLPVVRMAAATSRPGDVVGLHFFNPAPIMKLVEIVVPITTDADVVATAHEVCRRTRKVAVECGDRAGFIVNALLFPYLNNAARMLENGTATAEDIDAAMKGGCNFPMGPLALLDLVGLDTSVSILDALYEEFRDPNYAAVPALRRMVAAGRLGRKSGAGFYDYSR
jgi:3-hydroxybutyryl-CoA dehydrogenase